ncbi:GTPase HflX [Chloroflexota bacterium]
MPKERALLASVSAKGRKSAAEASLLELAELADTAGAEAVGQIIQELKNPSRTTYMGSGKLSEIRQQISDLGANLVIIDEELTPLQQRNIEQSLEVKIIDRSALILDIFAQRAQTSEGRLQVELAQHQYLLPRLAGQWQHLERLGGGIGTRGPGEKQIETDRRILRTQIHRLKKRNEAVRKHRQLYRDRRRKMGVPVVALIGYTSAGKSTLLNSLCSSDVLADKKLFSTLDPTTRRLHIPENNQVLLTDTVGFIRKLPPAVINAFHATLEELADASVLVHVVNMAATDAETQCRTVENILKDMDIFEIPRITVINKIDLLLDKEKSWDEATAVKYLEQHGQKPAPDTVLVSAIQRWGLGKLRELIAKKLI